jgi:ribonuclease HI
MAFTREGKQVSFSLGMVFFTDMLFPLEPIFFRDECFEQTNGYVGAKFKKFANSTEAEHFVAFGNSLRALGPAVSSDVAGGSKGKKRALSLDVEDELGWDVVYSDGACKGNGNVGSVAGVGVWWGHNDPRFALAL